MATETAEVVREQLLKLLQGGRAHMHFEEAVENFPLEQINTRLPNSDYTPWRLLEHMRIAQWDIVEFVRDPAHVSPPWPEGYWPPADKQADADDWKKTLAGLRHDLEAFQAVVSDPGANLWAPIPHAPKYTIVREVLVLADHNAYHLGEFGLMRTVIGA